MACVGMCMVRVGVCIQGTAGSPFSTTWNLQVKLRLSDLAADAFTG